MLSAGFVKWPINVSNLVGGLSGLESLHQALHVVCLRANAQVEVQDAAHRGDDRQHQDEGPLAEESGCFVAESGQPADEAQSNAHDEEQDDQDDPPKCKSFEDMAELSARELPRAAE